MGGSRIRRAAAATVVGLAVSSATQAEGLRGRPLESTPPADSTSSARISQAQRGWVPQWDVYYGGFLQLDELAARDDGSGWGVDVALFDRIDHSIFVRFGHGEVRAVQTESGFGVRALTLAGSSGWAVGDLHDRGAVFSLAGDRWVQSAGAAAPLHAVALVPGRPDRGWAVGDEGGVLRLGPSGWVTEAFPDRLARLRAVAALGVEDAWALEERGYLWHRSTEGWMRLDEPEVEGAAAMAFGADGRGVALGTGAFGYSAGSWGPIASPGARATGIAWAGGQAFAAVDGGVSRWDGSTWTSVPLPTTPLRPRLVDQIASAGPGWVASDRGGALLAALPDPVIAWPFIKDLQAIDAHLEGTAWAVGTSLGSGLVGSVPRDGSWNLTHPMPARTVMTGLSLFSRDEGWAVGTEFPDATGRPAMLHLTAAGWVPEDIDANWGLTSVQTLAANDAWASGSGAVVRWNGDSWKLVESAPFGTFTGPLVMIRGGDDPEGWFAAKGGLFHLESGAWRWVDLAPHLAADQAPLTLVPDPFDSVWMLAGRHVLRVAPDETVELLPDPPVTLLRDLSISPLGTVWVLAEPDGLLRLDLDHGVWEYHPLGVAGGRIKPRRIQALDQAYDPSRPPPDGWEGHDVWMVGAASAVARFRIAKPSVRLFLPALQE